MKRNKILLFKKEYTNINVLIIIQSNRRAHIVYRKNWRPKCLVLMDLQDPAAVRYIEYMGRRDGEGKRFYIGVYIRIIISYCFCPTIIIVHIVGVTQTVKQFRGRWQRQWRQNEVISRATGQKNRTKYFYYYD
jgi:hypothetical protein